MFSFNEDSLNGNSRIIFIFLICCCILMYLGIIIKNAIVLYSGIGSFCLFLIIVGAITSLKDIIIDKDYKQLGILFGLVALTVMIIYGIKRDILNKF